MKNKGFTLIEVLLSVFIITVGVLALYNAINYSYNSTEKAKDRFVASYLAEEGVELVKNVRDWNFVAGNDWTDGLIENSNDPINCNTIYGCRMSFDDAGLTKNNNETEAKEPLLLSNAGYNYWEGTETIFSRRIMVTSMTENKIRVRVGVNYGEEEFLLEQYLYNWK